MESTLISSRFQGPLGVRIIGVLKLITAALGMAVGFGLFRLFKSDVAATLEQTIRHLRLDPENRLIHLAISWISGLQPRQLHLIELGTFFYASLHTIEGIGLLTGKRWGAFLTILATTSLIPLECFEIYKRPRPLRIAVLVINVGIAIYLIANRDKLARVHLRAGKKAVGDAQKTGGVVA
jgi:uncharacterized membrane protein (DUF2068 family)